MAACSCGRDGVALLVLANEATSQVATADGRACLDELNRYPRRSSLVPPKYFQLWLPVAMLGILATAERVVMCREKTHVGISVTPSESRS